jgi:lipopolysaccharide/colanic/teichoic acid biosynthesis glycosyltransferase
MITTYRRWGKRALDLVISAISLIVLAPIIAIIILLVYADLGLPILFRQLRPGLMGKPFILFKFRTMRDLYKPDDQILPDAERLTKLGKILRSFSLDELPTLLNVLKGDMSIVGPRPLLMQYLARYSPEQARRHDVKPGITGWAQINGRNSISWEKKFNLDVWYIKNYSLILDMKILILTIWKSIKREGINQPGEATSREFMGSIH